MSKEKTPSTERSAEPTAAEVLSKVTIGNAESVTTHDASIEHVTKIGQEMFGDPERDDESSPNHSK